MKANNATGQSNNNALIRDRAAHKNQQQQQQPTSKQSNASIGASGSTQYDPSHPNSSKRRAVPLRSN